MRNAEKVKNATDCYKSREMVNFSYYLTMLVFGLLLVNCLLAQSSYVHYDIENVESYFEEFIIAHNKQYHSKEERFQRLMIFAKNLIEINWKNKESTNAVYGNVIFVCL